MTHDAIARTFLNAIQMDDCLTRIRAGLLKLLASDSAQDRGRRQLLIALRQNERLHEQFFRTPCTDEVVLRYMAELEALLARERVARKARKELPR